jgi:hypothetical protein
VIVENEVLEPLAAELVVEENGPPAPIAIA